MAWPWRRRKGAPPRHALPRQAAGWAEPAFPPASPPEAPATPAPAPSAAPAVEVPVQATGVLLGFADGSQVALDERDPSALALRAVADLLVQDRAV